MDMWAAGAFPNRKSWGWPATPSPTGTGLSAGMLASVRTGIAASLEDGQSPPLSPDNPGRLIQTAVRLRGKTVHIVGVYLHTGGKCEGENISLLLDALSVSNYGRSSTVIIGDLNLTLTN